MLQPLQLEQVSARYANEIAELHDFFGKAGLLLHTPDSFAAVAARVRGDRAFSRDLSSHVWVFLHAGNRQVSYADLLGIVAMAAAGPKLAASANEADAHDLLGFLMETRSAFEVSSAARRERLPSVPAIPMIAAEVSTPISFVRHVEPKPERPLSFEMPQEEDERRPLVWLAVAACLLLLLLGGAWLFHSSSTDHGAPVVATTEPAPMAAPATVAASRNAVPTVQRHEETAVSHRRGATRATASSRPLPPPAGEPFAPKPSPATTLPSVARATPTEIPNSPRLLHRLPTAPSAANPAAPGLNVVPLPATGSNVPMEGAVRKPTVRATSLGTMAANVMYSPAPVYPPAASSLHVQGEVKLEAEVDRTGTVVSTRIISGPPLLQEAAADALQQWRYRPFLHNDKPIGMNATVVMDFQLP